MRWRHQRRSSATTNGSSAQLSVRLHRIQGNLDRAYLRAKLNVCGNDRDLTDGDNQDCADHAQESEHIVVTTLVLPKALENEHELNEEHGKWNQASK